MARTSTIYIDVEQLANRGAEAANIVRLMMACNDLSLANEAMGKWREKQSNLRLERQHGALLYFARLQFAHLFEGLKAIDGIRADPYLFSLIDRCDEETKKSFQHLQKFLLNGTERKRFLSLVEQLRNNVVFHYDEHGKLIRRALESRASKPETRRSSINRGSSVFYWHFTLADEVVDSIVVRKIWKVPMEVDAQSGADDVVQYIHDIFIAFMDFSGEFIWKYFQK